MKKAKRKISRPPTYPGQETVQTIHPEEGKKGVIMLKRRYDLVAPAIVETLREKGTMRAMELYEEVGKRLEGKFDGKPMWYAVAVKLDLEARGVVKSVRGKHALEVSLVNN